MDSERRPEDVDVADLDLQKINNLDEDSLRKLGSDIGINFCNPAPKKRSRRQRTKPKAYVPVEKLRDWCDVKQKQIRKKVKTMANKTSVTRKSAVKCGKNSFGGVNAKKQRIIFSSQFTTSVHRPVDVYKGMCVCMHVSKHLCVSVCC